MRFAAMLLGGLALAGAGTLRAQIDDPAAFVRELHREHVDRDPSPAEALYWDDRISRGATEDEVRAGVLASRPAQERAKLEPAPSAPAESPLAAEIAAIRARVGSNVPGWHAFGATDHALDASGFAQSLDALDADRPPAEFPAPQTLGDAFPPSEGSLRPTPPLAAVPLADSSVADAALESTGAVETLAQAERQLEFLAQRHEASRRFDDADRLRRLAHQLRREKRRMLVGETSPASDARRSDDVRETP